MAEIRIEHKPKRKIWPLILGLLVAALLVWGLMVTLNNDRDDKMDAAQLQQSRLVPVSLAAPSNDLAAPAIDLVRAA